MQSLMATALRSLDADDYDIQDIAAFTVQALLPSDEREVLDQLIDKGPVWDGDVVSKAGRDGLLEKELAVKCVAKGTDGYQVATYRGLQIAKAGGRKIIVSPDSK